MTLFSKATLAFATASTALVAVPAQARGNDLARRDWGRHDGIDAGDVIAGALIIGGIAAIASASSRDDRYYGDRRYYDRGYDNEYGWNRNGYGSRQAVDQCVRAAQREAGSYGWARVTDVTQIDRVRGGYQVRGRLVVEDRGGRGWGDSWNRNRDRYGYYYDRYNDGYDKGRFTCTARYGNVDDIRLSGLRNYYR